MTATHERRPADTTGEARQHLEEVAKAVAGVSPEPAGREALVDAWASRIPASDVLARSVEALAEAVEAHLDLGRHRPPEGTRLATRPPGEGAGPHGCVDLVVDDMPFLVDSLIMALARHDIGPRLLVHPVVRVVRDDEGALVEVLGTPDGSRPDWSASGRAHDESWIHVELDGRLEDVEAFEDDVRSVLRDVSAAVQDYAAMRRRAVALASDLTTAPPRLDPEAVPDRVLADPAEAGALLRWMADHHFVFLGFREYVLEDDEDGESYLRSVPGSGLGILGEDVAGASEHRLADLPEPVRRRARERSVLTLTNANRVSTVHRPSYLDYVGVRRFDEEGEVVGERRFLGLFTRSSYGIDPWAVPVVRRKVTAVERRAALPHDSHDGKQLRELLGSFPRGELFQSTIEELHETAMGVLSLQERRQVRLFVRLDGYGRFVSCLVYVPRDRYTTEVRERMQDVLLDAFDGADLEHGLRLTESALARIHFVLHTTGERRDDVDLHAVEQQLAAAVRTWADAFVEEAERAGLDDPGLRTAFSASYRDDFSPSTALTDLRDLQQLQPRDDLALRTYRPRGAGAEVLRAKLLRTGSPLTLSDLLPVLENLGVRVVDERPYRVTLPERPPAFVYDLGLRLPPGVDADADDARDRFAETFLRTWSGSVEGDGLNRLVLLAGITARQVAVLRAYAHYLRQVGWSFSPAYVERVLAAHPEVARDLVAYFEARFDPDAGGPADERTEMLEERVRGIEEQLDEVQSLDEDRILRGFLRCMQATLRTNAFRDDEVGGPRSHLALKLDPDGVPDLPLPKPAFEVFVYAPAVEGVHLRGGKVARGGLRWSDRQEDFRTEVLGLMKAQMVKNALIVPVGAKGGFVVKRPPQDREALGEEVRACYRTFIRGLLDVTDDLRDGEVAPPPRVLRYDDDDPYLVVAADKGTATFSDLANRTAAEYGYWLGDAFASGGSSGYDHKEMAITARGAWVSVRRHLDEAGIGADDPITAVGIGDMSGDVFGNGMLETRRLRLVAAFDHRHVFLDPDPDPDASYDERARLFALDRSTWEDYDSSLISEGGGVWPRTAKSIPVSPQARAALGLDDDVEQLPPTELVQAVLRAPVHLLWNGGIGTYVKARTESHADVGDRSNDAVRVDGADLRCTVVGEGGNLGFTQLGRVEFAQGGGHIYTDAIDNSGGVDCSDHEVNIKILLRAAIDAGELDPDDRDDLLAEMTEAVAESVLADNRAQTRALANARAGAADMVSVHHRVLRTMESAGRLDRPLERLPDDEELERRAASGEGLTPPEVAVVLAYVKNSLYDDLLASDLPDEEFFTSALDRYFPPPLPERFPEQVHRHRLRRELVATAVANTVVNRGGTSFMHRLTEETGAPSAAIARAHAAALEVLDGLAFVQRLEEVDVAADVRTRLILDARRLVERATRWLLRNRPDARDVGELVETFRPGPPTLRSMLPDCLSDSDREALDAQCAALEGDGVPSDVAADVVALGPLFSSFPIVDVAERISRDIEDVAVAWFAVGDQLALDWLRDQVTALPRGDRWSALARDALREELYAVRGEVVEQALACEPSTGAATCVQEWLGQRPEATDRALRVFGDLRGIGHLDAAGVTVALREVRTLLRVGGAAGRAENITG